MCAANKAAKEKYKNIEFLRFIFAVLIVLFHFKTVVKGYSLSNILPGINDCTVCVDYFFIIAGFFLFKNFSKITDTLKFAIKKFLRFAPLVWFSMICYIFLSLISKFHFNLESNFLRFFLLSNIGFSPKTEPSSIYWFIPVLFWCELFYFYIAKIFEKKYLNLIIWIIVVFCLSGYLQFDNFNSDVHTKNFYLFFNLGILRGLAGIGIGYFISMLFYTDILKKCSKITKILISLSEIFIIGFVGHYMLFSDKIPGKSPFVYVLCFSIILFLFLRKQGIVSKLLNNNISTILGASSYSIYIIHPIVIIYLKFLIYKQNKLFVEQHALIYTIFGIILSIIAGFLVHYFVENKINKFIKNKFI